MSPIDDDRTGAEGTDDAHPLAPSALRWPDGMDERGFLERHWQRSPVLLRQALPGFETPLPADELAGLSLEPGTTPRLIRRDATGAYRLEHGPFDAATFAALGPRDWSLLVTDVDKHLPPLAAWLAPFRLAPDWRLDDLMVSYAPDGASVGAHVDEYDVFLLQASGTRRWSIDERPGVDPDEADHRHGGREDAGGDLRLLADFEPTSTWDLEPGDVLYLPPGVPHHGVAVGDDCTTWSIGFRAPSAADVVSHLAERVAERLASRVPQVRLRDAGRGRGAPGEIDAAAVDAVETLWREATALDRETLVEMTGELLTSSGTIEDELDARRRSPFVAEDAVGRDIAPFTRLAWSDHGGTTRLFVNGETFECSRALARRLHDDGPLDGAGVRSLDARDRAVLLELLGRQVLIALDETP